jgi:hypothetical protein
MIEVDEQPRKRKRLKEMSDDEFREHRRKYMQEYRQNQSDESTPDTSETNEEFWGKNRKLLSDSEPEKLTEWNAREAELQTLTNFLRQIMNGSEPFDDGYHVDLRDVVEDVNAEIAAHGTLQGDLFLYAHPRWWKSEEMVQRVERMGEADQIALRYGVVIAISTTLLHRWREFLKTARTQTAAQIAA